MKNKEDMEIYQALQSWGKHGTVIDDKEFQINIILKLWKNTERIAYAKIFEMLDKEKLVRILRKKFTYPALCGLREILEDEKQSPAYKMIEFLNKNNIKIYGEQTN